MLVLTGKNLGERHRELNSKVSEVISNKINWNDIKTKEETSDIGKLFQIDIASQYKDVDYIIEVLKSGDSLYISRALQCLWLYHDNYSHIMNAENLHVKIFPFMSMKMKKKMLSTLSMHIDNSDRAANYFVYCKKNQMPKVALKFLNYASEEFKLNVLKTEDKSFKLCSYISNQNRLKNFIGNSFILAATYIDMFNHSQESVIYYLRYLYAINNKKYLDLLEKCAVVDFKYPNSLTSLGIRTSRDIMTKHKNRVLEHPILYIYVLNKSMFVKHTSECEAKKYLSILIPQNVEDFWNKNFFITYDFILNLIPINEKFKYMKLLFTSKYPGEPFEMGLNFYEQNYYSLLSTEQRELWALRHIDEQKEILGNGNDYLWLQFVNIDKALIEIKKYIYITPDSDKRSDMVNILVKAAGDQKDLKKLLDYYYERHVNEKEYHKTSFIDKLFTAHNVFEFNYECWEALSKLFHSLGIYTVGSYNHNTLKAVAVVCHILHNIDMPQALIDFVELDVNYFYFTVLPKQLDVEKSEKVFQYLLKLFIDKLKPFEEDPYNKILRQNLLKYVNNIFGLISHFKKGDKDCPEIVTKFMNIHAPKSEECVKITEKDIYRFIKTNAVRAVDALGYFDLNINEWPINLKYIFRKLKVYFHNDVAQDYIKFLVRLIDKTSDDYASSKLINSAIFGLFQLTDDNFKVNLMNKYYPSNPKINHSNIDKKLLHIQQAICKFAGYSRPSVPMKNVLQYIKGDYVTYCLPVFNMYLANLPFPLVLKFIESTLNAPLSVQKHSLRLAFKCYSNENLKELVLNTWKKSKNVSLRKIIYESLFYKLKSHANLIDEDAKVLYEALKFLTSNLHQDDHEEIFKLLSSDLIPCTLRNDYLQTAWHMVIKLPKRSANIQHQTRIIRSIEENINIVQRNFVYKSIINEHIHDMLELRNLRPDESYHLNELWDAKWNLTVQYILKYDNNEELEQNLDMFTFIFNKCVEMWHYTYNEICVFQKFFFNFIGYMKDKVTIVESHIVPIFKHAIDILQKAFPLKNIYLHVWDIKLIIYFTISIGNLNIDFHGRREKLQILTEVQIQQLSYNIANDIKKIVQELLVGHQFYPVYLPEIALTLKSKFIHLSVFIDNFEMLFITFCCSLANTGLKETLLLTLMILPKDAPEKMRNMHTEILEKIQAFENDEVQSFLHYKFLAQYGV